MRFLLVLLRQTSLARWTETSFDVKLARATGWSSLFRIESESVDVVGRGVVGTLKDPEGFLLLSFNSVEWLVYNKTNIIAKIWHHCIVSPIPPKMPWNMVPMPVVGSLTACPVDSITLNAASPRLPTNFSPRSPTAFKVSWIAPPKWVTSQSSQPWIWKVWE